MGSQYIVLIVIVVLMVAMMGFSMFGNKKKKKKAEEMMNSITKGVKLKTIGGFVGTVIAIDDKEGVMILNLGDDENPINVTIDKAAVYTVLTPLKPVVVETEDGNKIEVEVAEEGAKSIDDLEADAIAKEKAEKRAAKKREKKGVTDVMAIEEPQSDADNSEVRIDGEVIIDSEVSNTETNNEVKN